MTLRALTLAAAAVAILGACGGDGGAEGRGDAAYGAGRYQEALAAYAPLAETTPSARLWAKVGASALHLGQLHEATEAYRALAAADLTRADEAAEGLERVIQAAERRLDQAALEEAVAALRQVAPGRSLGRHAQVLVQGAEAPVPTADLAAALATASEPGTADSLLLRQASGYLQRDDCAEAIPSSGRRRGAPGARGIRRQRPASSSATCRWAAHSSRPAPTARRRGSATLLPWTPPPRSAGRR